MAFPVRQVSKMPKFIVIALTCFLVSKPSFAGIFDSIDKAADSVNTEISNAAETITKPVETVEKTSDNLANTAHKVTDAPANAVKTTTDSVDRSKEKTLGIGKNANTRKENTIQSVKNVGKGGKKRDPASEPPAKE